MEDGISRWLHHHCKACCEKDGCHGRQTLIVGKECTMEIITNKILTGCDT